jgi:hypothetical protein
MSNSKKASDNSKYDYENLVEKLFLWAGVVFLFIGFMGLFLVIIIPNMYGKDQVLPFALTFVYSYMSILGIFLILYRSKIWVRGYRT